MCTGCGWEGLEQVCLTVPGVRHVAYLSAPEVALSTWSAVTNVELFYLFSYVDDDDIMSRRSLYPTSW